MSDEESEVREAWAFLRTANFGAAFFGRNKPGRLGRALWRRKEK
jgi:hypothetical protein